MMGRDERLIGEPVTPEADKARHKLLFYPATHREDGRALERWLGPHLAYWRFGLPIGVSDRTFLHPSAICSNPCAAVLPHENPNVKWYLQENTDWNKQR